MTCPSTLKWLRKKAVVRKLGKGGSAGRRHVQGECLLEGGEREEIEQVHEQDLIIVFMSQGDGISLKSSPATFG
jgi:hypothetical protein